jgi:phage tail-like protein
MFDLLRVAKANDGHGTGQSFADTSRYDPYKSYKFSVQITGNTVFAKAGFQKVSGLKFEVDVIEYREGGDELTTSKSPGLTKYDPITLERGMSEDVDMWNWAQKVIEKAGGFRANVSINLKDRDGTIVKTWNINNAWVSGYATGEFDAQGNAVMIETLTVQHEGFTKA